MFGGVTLDPCTCREAVFRLHETACSTDLQVFLLLPMVGHGARPRFNQRLFFKPKPFLTQGLFAKLVYGPVNSCPFSLTKHVGMSHPPNTTVIPLYRNRDVWVFP